MGGGGVWQKDSSSSTGTRRGVHLLPLSVTKYGVSQSALIKNSTTEELKTQQMVLLGCSEKRRQLCEMLVCIVIMHQ